VKTPKKIDGMEPIFARRRERGRKGNS